MGTSDLSERLVDGLNATYGRHPGSRAAHAKGVLCSATFVPTPDAAQLSRAEHFAGGETYRAHVRFSNSSGDPNAPDQAQDARGIAVKIYLAGGDTTDLLGLTLPVFFSRTPEDLIEFNDARRPDPATGEIDMDRVGAFLAEHPETVPAVTAAISAPSPRSYAQLRYHGLHAFRFEADDGSWRFGRYHFEPAGGEAALGGDELDGLSADYLREELADRLEEAPAVFHLDVELAEDEDPLDDPTAAWPDGRERKRVGRLTVDALAFDRDRDGDVLVFDPTRVTDGIEVSDDPVLLARSGAYSVSVARRTGS